MFEHTNTRKHVYKHSCSSVRELLNILAQFFSDFEVDTLVFSKECHFLGKPSMFLNFR